MQHSSHSLPWAFHARPMNFIALRVAVFCLATAGWGFARAHDANHMRTLPLSTEQTKAQRLPLGDGKISTTPRQGYVMACNQNFRGGGGAHRVGDWITSSADGLATWEPGIKPQVEGAVAWPNAAISVSIEGDQRVVRSNNLPLHASGIFPIRPGSKAYEFDRNPNRISPHNIVLNLPTQPLPSATPGCVPMGMVGFALSGVAIFNAFDLAGRDAPAYEIQDACNGHPERTGQYHYHDWSDCIPDANDKSGQHSSLAGFMLDGFPIYGPQGAGGKEVKNGDLDACHGHMHEVVLDGKTTETYHYHFTREYPYTIGCFKGEPVRASRL